MSERIERIINGGSFDLHVHTNASDGFYTPAEMVFMAERKGLKYIAITDHDTTAGIKEAVEASKNLNVSIVPGIELSTKYKNTSIDILGYFIDDSEKLTCVLKKMREHRLNRSEKIIKLFCEAGMQLSLKDVKKHTNGEVIARPHIAKAVVEKGYAEHIQEVFDLYLGDGKPCEVAKLVITPSEGIEMIHEAGGIAVLAHPVHIKNDELVAEIMKLPFTGIEVWHRSHGREDIDRYKNIANEYGKLMTGGSDYHHDGHSLGEFGRESN